MGERPRRGFAPGADGTPGALKSSATSATIGQCSFAGGAVPSYCSGLSWYFRFFFVRKLRLCAKYTQTA
jgi:hypothetical protein